MAAPTSLGDDLWSRYLDWCSAKIAEHILGMPADEVWRRAREAPTASAPPSLFSPEFVQNLSTTLFAELDLPDYLTWRGQYLQDPTRFDQDLAGIHHPEKDAV